jgi:hypothetical protein
MRDVPQELLKAKWFGGLMHQQKLVLDSLDHLFALSYRMLSGLACWTSHSLLFPARP